MKEYKCMDCLTSFEAEYKEDCPSCGDDSDVIEVSAHTDKLSVEKLIEKEIKGYEVSYKISGRRSENYIAGILEGLKIARAYVIDSLITDEKTVEKLQEQLNTAKKALIEIAEIIDDDIHECNYGCDNHCELNGSLNMYSVENLKSVTESALAAIGGDDEQ